MAIKTDYSFLSQVVLDDISDDRNKLNAINPNGWLNIAESSGRKQSSTNGIPNPTDGGFAAMAFRKGNEIIISYAGTEFRGNGSSVADVIADINLAIGNPDKQAYDAAAFYLSVKKQNPSADITFTGHSLGGGLATLMTVFFDEKAEVFSPAPFLNSARIGVAPNAEFPQPAQMADVASTVYNKLKANFNDTELSAIKAYAQSISEAGHNDLPALYDQRVTKISSTLVAGDLVGNSPIRNPLGLGLTNAIIPPGGEQTISLGNSPLSSWERHSGNMYALLEEKSGALASLSPLLPQLWPVMSGGALYGAERWDASRDFRNHLLRHEYGYVSPTGTSVTKDEMLTHFINDVSALSENTGSTWLAVNSKVNAAVIGVLVEYYWVQQAYQKELFTVDAGVQFDFDAIKAYINSPNAEISASKSLPRLINAIISMTPELGPDLRRLATINAKWHIAGDGAMTAYGSSRDDIELGGSDADTLNGGGGNDLLVGGAGSDQYIFNANEGTDTVIDSDGQGSLAISAKILTEAKLAGRQGWKTDDGKFNIKLLNGDINIGGTLEISGDGLGSGKIIINNFHNENLGLHLEAAIRTSLKEGLGTNEFEQAGFSNAGANTASLKESLSKTIRVDLNAAAKAGDKVTIAGVGDSAATSYITTGDQTLSLANGPIEITLNAGQTQVYFALSQKGDIDDDSDLTLTSGYISASGADTSQAQDTLDVSIDAQTEPDTPLKGDTSRTINGDFKPADPEHPGYDSLGNLVIGGEVQPNRDDTLFDSADNDTINAGGGDDTIIVKRGGNDQINAGAGDDNIEVTGGGDKRIDAGDGKDTINFNGSGKSEIKGGYGNDYIQGGNDDDLIQSSDASDPNPNADQDRVFGRGGDDRLYDTKQETLEEALEKALINTVANTSTGKAFGVKVAENNRQYWGLSVSSNENSATNDDEFVLAAA